MWLLLSYPSASRRPIGSHVTRREVYRGRQRLPATVAVAQDDQVGLDAVCQRHLPGGQENGYRDGIEYGHSGGGAPCIGDQLQVKHLLGGNVPSG